MKIVGTTPSEPNFSGRSIDGVVVAIAKGRRVRVVKAHKSGDVGITSLLEQKQEEARAVFASSSIFQIADKRVEARRWKFLP